MILLLLLPGVYISGVILVRGVREDYADHVEGLILRPGYPGRLLFPGNFVIMIFSKPVLGFAAFSGTGKTTLLEKLIPQLTKQGIRIGMVKHAHHRI